MNNYRIAFHYRLALAVLCLALGTVPATLKAETGAEQLVAFLAASRTLEAAFTQELFDEASRLKESTTGRIYVQRPGKFRWTYADEYGQDLIGDGENIWIFDRGLEQVTVRPFDETLRDSPAVLLTSDQPITDNFEVRDIEPRGASSWVELTPLRKDGSFGKIRVGLAGGQIRYMELVDNFANTTLIRFSDVQVNESLEPGLFTFTPPDGVDVIRN